MHSVIINVILYFSIITISLCSLLENVSDDDVVHMIKNDEYVIVLFSKKNCDKCDEFEIQLSNLKEDFKETLNAHVVKSFNSQLVRLYSPTKEPAIIFFRHGIPLLYDGPINEDSIFTQFDGNRVPTVKELSDENFEHLTQASTGATTGDWFILFYTQECIDCQRLSAVWEAVGAALKNRVNVARINKNTVGKLTSKRFNIVKAPEFIFIRQGKFYRYEITNYEIKSFTTFAQEWYRNAKVEKVKIPASPFDDLVSWSAHILKETISYIYVFLYEHPYFLLLGIGSLCLTIITIIVAKCLAARTKSSTKEQQKKKKTKSK